jgi:hypothetical protein
MEIINEVNKSFQLDARTLCSAKTVIYVPTKVIRDRISVLFEELFCHKTNNKITRTHFVLIMLIIKGKIVEGARALARTIGLKQQLMVPG